MLLIFLAVATALFLTVLFLFTKGNAVLPVAIFSIAILFVIVWRYPTIMMMFTVGSVCLLDTSLLTLYKLPRIDQIPLFWDINTIIQRYAGLQDFHAIPYSLFEVLLILAGFSSLFRALYGRRVKISTGFLGGVMLMFIAFVAIAIVNGLATGGIFTRALLEARPMVYLVIAYLISLNTGDDHEERMRKLMWISAICISIKAVHALIRYYVELGGATIPEIGIGAHEESFFFDFYILQFIVLSMARYEPKLRRMMLVFLPIVVWMDIINQRRVATAAFVYLIPTLIIMAFLAFKQYRAALARGTIIFTIFMIGYLMFFWNNTSSFGQPAHAIKSQFTPDARDLSSDLYRDAEDANLIETMKINPIFGYGYGKEFLIIHPMVDLRSIDPLIHFIPHNSLLWIWMRLGVLGYTVFWLLVGGVIVQATYICKKEDATDAEKVIAMLAATVVVMNLVFGLYDIQLASIRNMLFVGIWIGLLAKVRVSMDSKALAK
jgi:hypothetical protein